MVASERRVGRTRLLIAAVGTAVVGMAALGCTSSGAGPDRPDLELAIADGIGYVLGAEHDIDPMHMVALDYLHRRWGIDEFAAMRERAEQLLEAGELRGASPALVWLVDPGSEPPSAHDVADAHATEVAVLDALRCREVDANALWDGWRAQVRRDPDGYHATHVALALSIAADRGCTDPDGGALREEVIETLTVTVAEPDAPVDDLLLEHAAMLDRLDAWHAVPAGFADRVLESRRADGGWAYRVGDGGSHWHATMLAVWVLARTLGSGDVAEPLVPDGGRDR